MSPTWISSAARPDLTIIERVAHPVPGTVKDMEAPFSSSPVRVGLLGCGNVGAALAVLVDEQRDDVARRTGLSFELASVAVRDLSIDRHVSVPAAAFTTDAAAIVDDPGIDVVVEVMGGIEPARTLIVAALADAGLGDVPVVIGGVVPDEDLDELAAAGVGAVLGPGASAVEVVASVRGVVDAGVRATGD